mmetsp:Transcript_92869/g.215831  ORF Transcript_92869/g.215831 Transcript_92869/m.215831 type:complete len:230 (+) Transcript_92869:497-1186(+)
MIWFSLEKDSTLPLCFTDVTLEFDLSSAVATSASRIGPDLGLLGAPTDAPPELPAVVDSPSPRVETVELLAVFEMPGDGGSAVGCRAAFPHDLEGASTVKPSAEAGGRGSIAPSPSREKTCLFERAGSVASSLEEVVVGLKDGFLADECWRLVCSCSRKSLTMTVPWSSSAVSVSCCGSDLVRVSCSIANKSSISSGIASAFGTPPALWRPISSKNLCRSSTRKVQSYV